MSERGVSLPDDGHDENEQGQHSSSNRSSYRSSIASVGSRCIHPILHPFEYLSPVTIYLLRLLRDVLTFLVRGGLSTLMFFMDFVLGFFIFVFDLALGLPGARAFGNLSRFLMWCFQMAMWVVYVLLELLIYLPRFYLAIYIVFLSVLYLMMPDFFDDILDIMFWLAKTFLQILKNFVFFTDTPSIDFPDLF